MAAKEVEELSVCSEDTNSVCDEERTRKLFQACDTDGDGYIDSHDLQAICRELNLENCIESLIQELGADEEGKISFEKFLTRKIALRPEIHALKKKHSSRDTIEYIPTSSNNSLGKHDCWEFDSGARDLSPEPSTLQRLIDTVGGSTSTGNLLQLANKLHLAALASLRSEISELNTRLQSVSEERDILETALKKCQEKSENSSVQRYEEQITELHSVIAELHKKLDAQRSRVIPEEEDVISDTECCNNGAVDGAASEQKEKCEDIKVSIPDEKEEELKKLRQQCSILREHSLRKEAEAKHSKMLLNSAYDQIERMKIKLRESESRRLVLTNSPEVRRKSSSPSQARSGTSTPVLRVAERVRLPKIDRSVTGTEITSLGIAHTEVAEHLVSSVQAECNIQELCRQDKKHLEIETERLHSKLEHLRAQNNTLQINVHETRENCERMYLLLSKYESNAVALKLFSDTCQQIVDNYESLVKLLSEQRASSIQSKKEKDLRANIAMLKNEGTLARDTVVQLESYHCNDYDNRPKPAAHEIKKLDLEMAVLMQDLMEMRERNAELRATVYMLDRERETLELKIAVLQSQLQAYAYVKAEEQPSEAGDKESKLQERLKEVATTLEKVNRNADLRQKQSLELANQLKSTNCALMKTLERCKRKSQLKLQKLEAEMITMMEKHAAQVKSLKQRIQFLEELNKDRADSGRVKETSVTDVTINDNLSTTIKDNENQK